MVKEQIKLETMTIDFLWEHELTEWDKKLMRNMIAQVVAQFVHDLRPEHFKAYLEQQKLKKMFQGGIKNENKK